MIKGISGFQLYEMISFKDTESDESIAENNSSSEIKMQGGS